MTREIFISYRRADEAHARRPYELLKAEGVEAWYDALVGAGEDWRTTTAKALEAARIFVLLFTAAAAESTEIAKELAAATVEKKLIVPVRLENIAPKGAFLYELASRNWIDAYESTDARLQALAKSLAELVKSGADDLSALPFDRNAGLTGAPARAGGRPVEGRSADSTADAVLKRPAVAILPFRNPSGDPSQDYFADGVTEDLITALAAWRWFPVICRTSTFVYKGRTVDPVQVGREVGARYILDGAVRRAGDHVRITAELVESANGHQVWAQTYDRKIDDVFALQDEITREIVGAIEPQLTRAEQQRTLRKAPESFDAWDLSLQALALIRRNTKPSLAQAQAMLARAVELDRTSGYAQSLLALAHFHEALFGWSANPAQAFRATYEAASEAVALDDGDWLAHALLGIATLWTAGSSEKAVAEEEMAVALNPSAAMAYHLYGCVVTFDGRPAAALPKLEAVLKLDPRFQLLPTTLADIGLAHFLLGDHRSAVRYYERAIGEQRDHVRAWQRLAATLGAMGRTDEAKAAFAQVRRIQPDFSADYLRITYPFRDSAHSRTLLEGLRKAGWEG